MSKTELPQYCAIDLETTGFDPLTEQIIEIGLVFFSIEKGSFVVHDRFSSVFNPGKKLKTNITGLTGITNEELEVAPLFSDHLDFLKEKLEGCILVGHNVSFDIKFLTAAGLLMQNDYIDTLELVQFLLPTHHSYNLENLAVFLKLEAENTHRASDDAYCAMRLLERCIGIYQGFPPELQGKLNPLLVNLKAIYKTLNEPVSEFEIEIKKPINPPEHNELSLPENSVTTISNSIDITTDVDIFHDNKHKTLVILTNDLAGFNTWKHSSKFEYFSCFNRFSPDKFQNFLRREDKTRDEIIFSSKVLVWLATNWQTKYIFDLNLNYLGANFRPLICEKRLDYDDKHDQITDLFSYIQLDKNKVKNHRLVIIGLEKFEHLLVEYHSKKISWGNITNTFKQELRKSPAYFGVLEPAIEKLDLLFGLTLIFLRKISYEGYETFSSIEEFSPYIQSRIDYLLKKIVKQAEELNTATPNMFLGNTLGTLKECISPSENYYNILEWTESTVALRKAPISIEKQSKKLLENPKSVVFINQNLEPETIEYYKKRLGVTNFHISDARTDFKTTISEQQLTDLLSQLQDNLPAVIVFDDFNQLAMFYKQNLDELNTIGKLIVEKYSGGTGKIIRNFELYRNPILIATTKAFNNPSLPKINAKTVFFYFSDPNPNEEVGYHRLRHTQQGAAKGNYHKKAIQQVINRLDNKTLKKICIVTSEQSTLKYSDFQAFKDIHST